MPAGKTVTVDLYPTLTDFAVVNAKGEFDAAPGAYAIEFGIPEAGGYLRLPGIVAI